MFVIFHCHVWRPEGNWWFISPDSTRIFSQFEQHGEWIENQDLVLYDSVGRGGSIVMDLPPNHPSRPHVIRGFPQMAVPQNGWFIRENPIKMDDLGVPPFMETSIQYWNCIEPMVAWRSPILIQEIPICWEFLNQRVLGKSGLTCLPPTSESLKCWEKEHWDGNQQPV